MVLKTNIIKGFLGMKDGFLSNGGSELTQGLEVDSTYIDELAKGFIVVGSVYQHFKGCWYSIVTLARDSETLDTEVIYRNIETGIAYSRKLDNFLELVKVNDMFVPRFKYIHKPIQREV